MSLLEKARSLAQLYASQQLLNSATFWADKALSLSNGEATDLATYASLLHSNGQHRRAIHKLTSSPFFTKSAALRYLAAKCHIAVEEWEEALSILKPPSDDFKMNAEFTDTVKCPQLGDVCSASLLLQAKAHEGLGSIQVVLCQLRAGELLFKVLIFFACFLFLQDAIACHKEALLADVHCEEALEWLCSHHSLSAEEEKSLLATLPFKKQCTAEEEKMLRVLYQAKLRHSKGESPQGICAKDEALKPLENNLDIVWCSAYHFFHSKNIDACYRLTKQELQKDPLHPALLLLFIACCLEKSLHEELFALGHKLVNNFPCSALAWYAVSCYYLCIKNHQNTRKYLEKVISLDPHFPSAHLAFGHSFAMEGEHDHAISAFSKATRIMKGSHIPLMQLGREYHITGSYTTAVHFMNVALSMKPDDPSLLQEIGVMLAGVGHLEKATKYLSRAILCLQAVDPHMTVKDWEPVYNNLGHVYRRQKKYELALEMHHKALSVQPKEHTSLTAIAFIHLLQGNVDKAIEYCNRSLQLWREDQFTLALLEAACDEVIARPFHLGTESLDALEPENEILRWDQQSEQNGTSVKEDMQTD